MATVAARATREFDLIVYGANGFTGALAVDYLARAYPHLSIAIAGRDAAKIRARADATRESRGVTFPTVVARDAASREAMVRRARTVLTFAGPYDADAARAVREMGAVAMVVDAMVESCEGIDRGKWEVSATCVGWSTRERAGGGAVEPDLPTHRGSRRAAATAPATDSAAPHCAPSGMGMMMTAGSSLSSVASIDP